MLRAVKNDTGEKVYCGPTAVAAITGKPASKVLDAFRVVKYPRRRNPPTIVGTNWYDIDRVLRKFGWDMQPGRDPTLSMRKPAMDVSAATWQQGPTLAAWLRSRKGSDTTATFILFVKGGHWIAVRGRKMVDTWTDGVPVFIGKAPHRRARVSQIYRVERMRKRRRGPSAGPR